MNAQRILIQRIEDREAKVAIIGLGYVGLPLAVEFASAGLETVGIDLREEKVGQINTGESYIADVPSSTVRNLVEASNCGRPPIRLRWARSIASTSRCPPR